MNEQIVQVIVKGERILGLTGSGHLARFDDNLNVWVIQAKPEVFNAQNELITTNNIINARAMAAHIPVLEKKDDGPMIDTFGWVICIAATIGAIAVIVTYFI